MSAFLKSIGDPQRRDDAVVETGKGCLYIRKLADVDQTVLEQLITRLLKPVYPAG